MVESRGERNLRLLAVLDRWFVPLVVLVLAIGTIGGFATYTAYEDPGERTVENVVSTIEFVGEYEHGATVIDQNPVFPLNTELRGRSAYPARVAPILNGSYQLSYRASSSSDVSVELETKILLRTVDEETVYWTYTIASDSVTASNVRPGESVELPFSVNVSAATQQRELIEQAIGTFPGETETLIRTDARLDGEIEGESESHTRRNTLLIEHGDNVYSVSANGTGTERIERTEEDTVERQRGAFMSVGGPLALAVALLGLVGLGATRWREVIPLSEAEREWLDYRDDRSEFDEWITRIELPESVFDRPSGEAETLADLVDFGIDADTPVVESPSSGDYYVVAEDSVYVFNPPSRPTVGVLQSSTAGDGTSESSERDGSNTEGDSEDNRNGEAS